MPVGRYNRKNKIPGVSGNRIPGKARMPNPNFSGFHFTNIPFIATGEHASGEAGSAVFREYHRQQIRNSRGEFRGGLGFAWQGLSELDQAYFGYGQNMLKRTENAVRKLAKDMETWAKDNRKWTDQTEDARKGLQAAVVEEGRGNWTIYLGHGKDVYYGIWLEVRWGGKYAIILPTIYHFAPQAGQRVVSQT